MTSQGTTASSSAHWLLGSFAYLPLQFPLKIQKSGWHIFVAVSVGEMMNEFLAQVQFAPDLRHATARAARIEGLCTYVVPDQVLLDQRRDARSGDWIVLAVFIDLIDSRERQSQQIIEKLFPRPIEGGLENEATAVRFFNPVDNHHAAEVQTLHFIKGKRALTLNDVDAIVGIEFGLDVLPQVIPKLRALARELLM